MIAYTPDMADDSPAHTWAETANPANQWLRNNLERRRFAARLQAEGQDMRRRVRRAFREAGYPLPPPIRPGDDPPRIP